MESVPTDIGRAESGYLFEPYARVKGFVSYNRNAVGDDYLGQSYAICECRVTNAYCAFADSDACYVLVASDHPVVKVMNAALNGNKGSTIPKRRAAKLYKTLGKIYARELFTA